MRLLQTLFILLLFFSISLAQNETEPNEKKSNISLGLQMSSFGGDFGWGIHLTSPYFAKERLAVRVSAQYHYYEHIDTATSNNTWSPYWVFDLGFVSASTTIKDFIRLYSHNGAVFALPNQNFSDKPIAFGAFSKLGIELMFNAEKKAWGSYYIEGGWIGIFSVADKLPTKPIYGNGFVVSTGVRWYF